MADRRDTWSPEQVLDILGARLDHLDREMHRELEGFPEHYATQVEIDLLRQQIDAIRLDHVQRREIDEIKKIRTTSEARLQERLDEQAGRRQAGVIAISVIATITAVLFGFIWQSQPTRSEISDQIQREAPWTADKTEVDRRLDSLESRDTVQQAQISRLQAQARFFCTTRVKAGLPGC